MDYYLNKYKNIQNYIINHIFLYKKYHKTTETI